MQLEDARQDDAVEGQIDALVSGLVNLFLPVPHLGRDVVDDDEILAKQRQGISVLILESLDHSGRSEDRDAPLGPASADEASPSPAVPVTHAGLKRALKTGSELSLAAFMVSDFFDGTLVDGGGGPLRL